jgi:RNA polymerase sigma-70 factor (ECF subfamily)
MANLSTSDETLACQARSGDAAALESLVRRWQVPLVAFLQRRVGRADAEDLFQETFIRVQQNLESFDESKAFKTWIFTIAWRLAANHLRDRKPAVDIEIVSRDAGHRPDHDLEQADFRGRLWAIAREALNEEQYTMLWLFYVEQLPPRQIAQISGKSWVAVKTALHRARRTLQAHLRPLERSLS